jgi:Protein of unknown function (DUF2806)
MTEGDELPTLGQAISQWLGFQLQLPGIRLPQTLKNVDKAFGRIVLAGGENVAERIRQSTKKIEAKGTIDIAGMFRTEEERRKFKNKEAVARSAIEELRNDPGAADASSEIEDDWLNLFARLAEDKSSEELQVLFGRILAGEIRRPGSFSLRTLQLMALISRQDATDIITFLSYVIGGGVVPFRDDESMPGGPFDRGPSTNSLPTTSLRLAMEEFGIALSASPTEVVSHTVEVDPMSQEHLSASHRGFMVDNKTSNQINYIVAGQPITKSAQELIRMANLPPTDLEFMKEIANRIYAELLGKYTADVDAERIQVHIVSVDDVSNILFTAKGYSLGASSEADPAPTAGSARPS